MKTRALLLVATLVSVAGCSATPTETGLPSDPIPGDPSPSGTPTVPIPGPVSMDDGMIPPLP